MIPQNKQKRAQGPVQFAERIWEKISNDSRVRGALNKTRSFISNGPFIAIVVGTGGESKPVAFAVVPVVGLVEAGRIVQAIEETASGKRISINTVLTALRSIGALSIPTMVVGTVVSGAVNVANLFVKREVHQVPGTPTSNAKMLTSTGSTLEVAQSENQITLQGETQEIKQAADRSEALSFEVLSKGVNLLHPSDGISLEDTVEGDVSIVESDQVQMSKEGAESHGYRYKVIPRIPLDRSYKQCCNTDRTLPCFTYL